MIGHGLNECPLGVFVYIVEYFADVGRPSSVPGQDLDMTLANTDLKAWRSAKHTFLVSVGTSVSAPVVPIAMMFSFNCLGVISAVANPESDAG